jgi:hypothetical protein
VQFPAEFPAQCALFIKVKGIDDLVGNATACGTIPAGSALKMWPWTSVLNRLVD